MNMKQWCSLIALTFVSGIYADSVAGFIDVTTGLGTGQLSGTYQQFYANVLSYTSGGVTFTYPAGLFDSAPFLRITVALKNRPYRTYEAITYEVVSTSSAQTKVRVNVGNGVTFPAIFEASTNDVEVYLEAWALDDTLP